MSDFAKEILPVNLEDEMRQSYLDYAMSVIRRIETSTPSRVVRDERTR